MKTKILNLLLIITSLFGYLEWGGENSSFLFEAEYEVLYNLFTDPVSALHPFTIFPLLGQLMLLITLFQSRPSRLLTLFGMSGLALLLGFMMFIGFLEMNWKIIGSTVPFFVVVVLVIINIRRTRRQ